MPTLIKSSTTPSGTGAPDLVITKDAVKIHTGSLAYADSGLTKVTQVSAVITAREGSLNAGTVASIFLKSDGSDAIVTQNPDAELSVGTWLYVGRMWILANGSRVTCTGRRGPVPSDPSVKEAITYNVPSNPNLAGLVDNETAETWTAPNHPFQTGTGTGRISFTLRVQARNADCQIRRRSDGAILATIPGGTTGHPLVIIPDGDLWEFQNPGGTVTILCQEALEPVG